METKGQVCWRCRYFDRYYIKGSTDFKATRLGKCYCKVETVEAKGTCEQFKPAQKNRRVGGYLQKSINDYLIGLTRIRQILEEMANERDGTEEV